MTKSGYKLIQRTALLAAVVLALGATSAHARPFGPAEEAAWQEAVAFWGSTPALCTSITREVVASGSLGEEDGHDVGGRATQPAGAPIPCGVWIEEDTVEFGLCSAMRHEYGHLLGYGHDDPELAQMPLCSSELQIIVWAAWSTWRLRRGECRVADGPFGKSCWRQVKRAAARLRAGDYSTPIRTRNPR